MSTATRHPIVLIAGDDPETRHARGLSALATHGSAGLRLDARDAREWPFSHPVQGPLPEGPVVVWAPDVHHAFETAQPPHTRLVTTQGQYLFAEWATLLGRHGRATLVATAARSALHRLAPDIVARRGIGAGIDLQELTAAPPGPEPAAETDSGAVTPGSQAQALARAFRQGEPATRLGACVKALDVGRTAPALVAVASVCQEVNDLDSAVRDLDDAIALAPDWAAAHFERGKVCLRLDDMEGAARAFRRAAECLPAFGGAWGNLGATLGELDRPAEAFAAFERLLALDPASPQAHNNIGVVTRELGRLADSEGAFRRVIELEPNLAFGYYNLGHTLFLQGRYHAAASAYAQGQSRDPDRNPVQATRLGLCRLATGDAPGALAELQRASRALPRDYRRQVLADTNAVLWALVTQKPDLSGWQGVHEWLKGELSTLA